MGCEPKPCEAESIACGSRCRRALCRSLFGTGFRSALWCAQRRSRAGADARGWGAGGLGRLGRLGRWGVGAARGACGWRSNGVG